MNLAKYIFIFLWDVLHHLICQQTLVRCVTYFYICSECYYYHPTIYSKFCSWSTFLLDSINFAKLIFLFLWGVLHHFICQQTLVTSVTSFYICSECYYYHPTIYCKFCRESISTWYNKFCQINFSLFLG